VAKKKSPPAFEEALQELETLVASLEQGDQPLEQSLLSYERGVALTRVCQQALEAAEQKVRILSSNRPESDLEPFEDEPE
jgi:exodeoxyribonuclease VII small subunit